MTPERLAEIQAWVNDPDVCHSEKASGVLRELVEEIKILIKTVEQARSIAAHSFDRCMALMQNESWIFHFFAFRFGVGPMFKRAIEEFAFDCKVRVSTRVTGLFRQFYSFTCEGPPDAVQRLRDFALRVRDELRLEG